jgi:dTDP-4-dehydrorhamnose reductase
MNILVLGASGMIGRTMVRVLARCADWQVIASLRASRLGDPLQSTRVLTGIDLNNPDHLVRLFGEAKPDVVVNCAGVTKHLWEGNDPVSALSMNALLPHRLAALCSMSSARLIHVSTDCVFAGRTGNYREGDYPDALDIYGRTKALGEVTGDGTITLRTSTIGHEFGTKFGLLEWFLAQSQCKGFKNAIFSGLPTVEFARVVRDFVIPNKTLSGLYHVGAEAIDKFQLLHLINRTYGRGVQIEPEDGFRIDRSLNSERFSAATGYFASPWPDLVEAMYNDHISATGHYV